ncbi:MAG: LutC/YkgG family protein [Pyrinomonadaceae bacterium]
MTETEAGVSIDARESILALIRESLAASEPFDKARRPHNVMTGAESGLQNPTPPASPQRSLIETFRINLESVDGNCMIVKNENEAHNYLSDLVVKRQFKRVVISNSELVKRIAVFDDEFEVIENAAADILFDCDLGVTGAQWAIAETGTLVLESEAESHRLASLVPPVHLCVLRADRIRRTLAEILELTKADLSRTVTFITGASRTSDIELTLAIGVHGPAELHVIVIADQENNV